MDKPNNYCRCAFQYENGSVAPGEPCPIHPVTLTSLLKEKDRTGARVIGAAINAIKFYECQDYDTAFRILKAAVDSHNLATKAYIEFLSRSAERKEHRSHVHPAA